ncbi:MAG: LamG-like jellyroll fold domain-containing protein [Verrucomicrobiaceae bacterium]
MKPSPKIQFTTEEEKIFWIESIIDDFREGNADPNDVESLRALLLEDSGARKIYLESNKLTTLLESTSTITKTAPPRRILPFTRWAAGLGIAAALTIGLWVSFQNPAATPSTPNPAPWLATLSSSNEPVWDGPGAISGKFYPGKIKLKSGVAELEFQNGAQFIIEGPCALEIINGNKIELEYGKLWGHCPPNAQGFEVLAPGGNRIVDLGTEFGVGVAPSGEVEVHVFDGEVEVFSDNEKKRALDAGSALKIAPGEVPHPLHANILSFTNTYKLQSDLYHRHRSALLQREDLFLYYDFSPLVQNPYTVRDFGPAQLDGNVLGALPVKGRIADKGARLFEKEGDAVAVDLTQTSPGKQFTIAMWVKPTAFSRSHMALFNSNEFGPGKLHFQIHDDGRLMTAIGEVARYSSPRDTIKTNTWQMVAVSWDLETGEAQLYLNGETLEIKRTAFTGKNNIPSLDLGPCQIGSWAQPTYGHNRSFEGRIDEVMLFSGSLSESEMISLFEQSRP